MPEYGLNPQEIRDLRTCCEFVDDFSRYDEYFRLRDFNLTHEEAIATIKLPVAYSECQRLIKAGGSTRELEDLMRALEDADDSLEDVDDVLSEYVDLRCADGLSRDEAEAHVYKQYRLTPPITGIDP